MTDKTAKKIFSNIVYGQTRNTARGAKGEGTKEKAVNITAEDIQKKFKEQSGKCYWTGIQMEEKYNYISKSPLAISPDRLDNKRGYEYDNIALTLRICNNGKKDYQGDFTEVIRYLRDKI